MRNRFLIFLSIVLFIAFLGGLAVAAKPRTPPEGKTEIIADEADGVVRVMIRGKEAARFDEHGLHVTGGVVSPVGYFYTGSKGTSNGER